jgi:hypothetical protein
VPNDGNKKNEKQVFEGNMQQMQERADNLQQGINEREMPCLRFSAVRMHRRKEQDKVQSNPGNGLRFKSF